MRKSTHMWLSVCACVCSPKSTNEIFILILLDSQRVINIFNIRFYTQFTRTYISLHTHTHTPWRADSLSMYVCVCFNPFRHARKKKSKNKSESARNCLIRNTYVESNWMAGLHTHTRQGLSPARWIELSAAKRKHRDLVYLLYGIIETYVAYKHIVFYRNYLFLLFHCSETQTIDSLSIVK